MVIPGGLSSAAENQNRILATQFQRWLARGNPEGRGILDCFDPEYWAEEKLPAEKPYPEDAGGISAG